MKSNPSEAPSSGVSEKRRRRTLAEAASQLARSMMEGTLGGSPPKRGERVPPANSAAASVHRLRKVLERDRVNVAAQDPEAPEASRIVRSDHDEPVIALDPEQLGERVCETCGALELPDAARTQKPRAVLRVPPPPPPRRASMVELVADEQDEDEWLSVHNEPTRVRPPPALTERVDGRAAALAAAAASAFGSASASGSPHRH